MLESVACNVNTNVGCHDVPKLSFLCIRQAFAKWSGCGWRAFTNEPAFAPPHQISIGTAAR